MEIRKFIDNYGDDVYALALIVTKSFDSANRVFAETAGHFADFTEQGGIFVIAKTAFPICKECESNDDASTFTGIELSTKQETVLEMVLAKPQIIRAIIHLHYENDLTPAQIARVTGESERYVQSKLGELSEEFSDALDKHYKDICLKIHVEDALKAYVIRASETGEKRVFEQEKEPVPVHRWTKKQKIVVYAVAALFTVLVCIVIPIAQAYIRSQRELDSMNFEEPATDEIFSYTYEAETETEEKFDVWNFMFGI